MKHDKKIKELELKRDEYLEGWRRAQADYQNLKREHEEQIRKIGEIGAIGFVEKLLPIIDHFEMAINHVPNSKKDENWVKGFYHIKKQFDDMLSELGVKRIESVGKKFDPQLHDAVKQEESGAKEDEIIKEIKAGYMFGDSVIRPSKVIVSKNNINN